ncbi:uncharacterized protein LOC113440048 [Pseudonaja textilis]|uniref:uncharacterized protein LOC113440048 n=1 Tax=Pseudonaja textilis TaxID=8673 RepID=UPI000EAA56B6|nr:uncharacterized protein LOC113440048 [Pseudonaja textilis]
MLYPEFESTQETRDRRKHIAKAINCKVANCHNCVMEGEFKRRMRNFMMRLQDEKELSNGSSSTTTLIEARRRIELHTSRSHNYQFSRHQEDITTHVIQQEVACHDSCSTKCHHLEDRLTTERSLMEIKPEEHLKYAPVQDFRRNISDEALQVYKLKRENLSLRCKIEKLDVEKEEILKDNKYLKEELNRKKVIISHLLTDIEEFHCEKKQLTDIIRCLRWKKQQLCEKFEEKLNR